MKHRIRDFLPRPLFLFLRSFRTGEATSVLSFLKRTDLGLSIRQRVALVRDFYRISVNVQCAHLQSEMLSFACEVLRMPRRAEGVLVEAGCFKGGGTAKISLLARTLQRQLVVFDSFQGIPGNTEDHGINLYGGRANFAAGDYHGDLKEVIENVTRYGDVSVCRFVEGYFENTMPGFHTPIAAAYLDVDLASSTRTCLKYLWPLLVPGGVMFSEDGHLPLVLQVLTDTKFWETELECSPPEVLGMGKEKLVWFRKPLQQLSMSLKAS